MQSIGERLEEARKRRGISIREASEATKIRGDFLLNFENNQFDLGLPDIYVRGFLRNYSGFLKIDPEKIVTDFNSTLISEPKSSRKDSRELFGRLEIPERPRPAADGLAPTGPTAPRRQDLPDPARGSGAIGSGNRRESNPDLANYLKIGAIAVAGLVAVLVIVWLIMAIISAAHRPDRPNPERPAPSQNQATTDSITLIATGDVWVKVTQVNDNVLVFDGQLAKGEKKSVPRRGPVLIAYSVGANLQVEREGRTFKMTAEGLGRSTFP